MNEKLLHIVAKELVLQRRKRLDVWTPSKRSRSEQQEFKTGLVNFYDREDRDNHGNIFCMVLNRSYSRDKVGFSSELLGDIMTQH